MATDFQLELQRIPTNFRGERCFTHARAAAAPDGSAVITTQPLRLSGSDIFYGMHHLLSRDGGRTWSPPAVIPALARHPFAGHPGWELTLADATPLFHRASGRFLLAGMSMLYCDDELIPEPRPRHTAYSSMEPASGRWNACRLLDMPPTPDDAFFCAAAGCAQYLELENGDLLIPFYFMNMKKACELHRNSFQSAVMRCSFDGELLRCLEYGNALQIPVPRGLYEPSLIRHDNRFYLTLRNDRAGYVAVSDDGLHYTAPVEWRYDDGGELGNYNTQQHWISGGGKLYLVYTRRGAHNDHIFRHRAPLFIAETDPGTLRLIRATERIVIPERGARLGNFGCTRLSSSESWVVAAEWMQAPENGAETEAERARNRADWRRCAERGSDNSIFIAKLRFGERN